MKFGIFIPMEPAGREARSHYKEVIELVAAVEEMGYSSVWLASRHLSPGYAAVPSPLLLLSAAAQVTSQISLGTAVVSLPLEDPVRLAEDICTLDAISAGRARIGLGSGDDPVAFTAMGADFEDRRAVTSKRLTRLLQLLRDAEVGGLPIHPPPAPELSRRVSLGVQSEGGARWAASQGIGLMLGRSEPGIDDVTASQALSVAAYRDAAGAADVVVLRNVWIGSLSDPELAEGIARYDAYLRGRGRTPLPEGLEVAAEKMHIISGEADVVAQKLTSEMQRIGADEVAVTVDPGGSGPGEAEKRLARLAESLPL